MHVEYRNFLSLSSSEVQQLHRCRFSAQVTRISVAVALFIDSYEVEKSLVGWREGKQGKALEWRRRWREEGMVVSGGS